MSRNAEPIDLSIEELQALLDGLHNERGHFSSAIEEQLRKILWSDEVQAGNLPREMSVTRSLPNAIAFVGKALPGWRWALSSRAGRYDAYVAPDLNDPVFGIRFQVRIPQHAQWDMVAFFGTEVTVSVVDGPALALCESVIAARLMVAWECPNLWKPMLEAVS